MRIVQQRTRESSGPVARQKRRVPGARVEALLLLAVSLLAIAGVAQSGRRQLAEAQFGAPLNVNATDPAALAAVLDVFSSEADRTLAATRILRWIQERGGIDRVSALSRITTPGSNTALLTGADMTRLRPALSVRSAEQFWWKVLQALSLTLGPMWLIHLVRRRWTGIGDPILIPGVTFLLALGLMAMFTLRDPIRDGDIAISFATGVCLGAIGLMVIASVDVVPRGKTPDACDLLHPWGTCLAGYRSGTELQVVMAGAWIAVSGSAHGERRVSGVRRAAPLWWFSPDRRVSAPHVER